MTMTAPNRTVVARRFGGPPLTVDAWRARVAEERQHPGALRVDRAIYEDMSPVERRAYDQKRISHHSSIPPILTSEVSSIHDQCWSLVQMNDRARSGAHHGVVIDGLPSRGKSTSALEFGRSYELQCWDDIPEEYENPEAEFVPVLYVTLGQVGIKPFNMRALNFYGAPYPTRPTKEDLTERLVECISRCDTRVVIVDEAHRLAQGRDPEDQVNAHLKDLLNCTGATFVYAGIECLANGVFWSTGETKDEVISQMSQRFRHLQLEAFSLRTKESRREWAAVLREFERQLVLHNSEDGDLVAAAAELYEMTRGVIGSLSALIAQTANAAVGGAERITLGGLRRVRRERASEEQELQDKEREVQRQSADRKARRRAVA